MFDPEECFQLALETVDFRPEDEVLRVAHTRDGGEHIGAKRRELGVRSRSGTLSAPRIAFGAPLAESRGADISFVSYRINSPG